MNDYHAVERKFRKHQVAKNVLSNTKSKRSSDESNKPISGHHNLKDIQEFMALTYESFLLQMEEVFVNLKEERSYNVQHIPLINVYKDICEKLRLEILIALDKLELASEPQMLKYSLKEIKFLHKMDELKTKLFKIRWEYHNAMKELE